MSEIIFRTFLWQWDMSVEYVRCNSNCSRYFINYSQSGKKQPYFSLEDAINKQQCWSYVEVQLDSRPCKPLLQKYKILPFPWQLYILVRIANSKDPYQDCSMPQDGGWFHPHCIIMYENIHRVQKSVKKMFMEWHLHFVGKVKNWPTDFTFLFGYGLGQNFVLVHLRDFFFFRIRVGGWGAKI